MRPDESRPPRATALVIAHEPYGGAAQIAARLEARDVEVVTHQVTSELEHPERAVPFPSTDGFDLVVPMGSIRSLVTREGIDSWIDDEIRLLRAAHDDGIPILGVCFGGQLLATTLGGSVEQAPVRELGWYEISAPPGAVNPAGPGPWMQWHYDRFEPPEEAEVLAVTEAAVQLFRLGRTVGMQFHPEVDLPHLRNWIGLSDDAFFEREGVQRSDMLADAAANEATSIDGCHRLVDWFVDEVAQLSLPSASPERSSSPPSSTSDAEFMQ